MREVVVGLGERRPVRLSFSFSFFLIEYVNNLESCTKRSIEMNMLFAG